MLVLLVAILGALIPTLFYVTFVWWLDRYEKEPIRLLTLAFLWGAIPAAILSVLFELMLDLPITALGGESLAANLLSASLSAPLVEETFKGIAVVGVALLFRREFDDVLDGIIYGAMVGFGFALTENSLAYFLPILSEQGISAGLVNIFMRAVVFGVNHGFWTGLTGAAIGFARLSPRLAVRLLAPLGGWALAVLFHGMHNAGATLVEQTSCLSLGFSLAVDWGGVLLLLLIAAGVWNKESRWIEQGLREELRRTLVTPQEFDLLRSATARLAARGRAWGRGGRPAARAVEQYFQCATELAFKKQHLRTLGDEAGNLAEIEKLRLQLVTCRAGATPWLWPAQS